MDSYIPLDQISIATPCSASWQAMTGDDRVRHCADCSKSVYNISEMSRQEAESLISNAEGRLCIRMYRRADGTIITQDCPVGLQAVRARVARRIRTVAAAALTFVGSAIGINTAQSASRGEMGRMVYIETEQVADTTTAKDTLTEPPVIMMGAIAPAPAETETEDSDSDFLEMMGEISVAPVDIIDADAQAADEPVGTDESISTSADSGSEVAGPSVVPAVVVRPGHAEPGIR